jgi:hypothetical protein
MGVADGWAVTQYGETLQRFPSELQAMNWLHANTSTSIDWAVRNSGYDIVHIRDDKAISSYRQDVLIPRIKKAVAGGIDPESAAELFEESVQEAFTKVYGFPRDISVIGQAVKSSFLKEGKKTGWTTPDPNVVLVFTEYAWVPDPWSGTQVRDEQDREWNQAAELLKKMGWPNASWDSINSAVQIVYWRPDSWFVLPEHIRAKK